MVVAPVDIVKKLPILMAKKQLLLQFFGFGFS